MLPHLPNGAPLGPAEELDSSVVPMTTAEKAEDVPRAANIVIRRSDVGVRLPSSPGRSGEPDLQSNTIQEHPYS